MLKIIGGIIYTALSLYAGLMSYLTFFNYPHGSTTGHIISIVISLIFISITTFILHKHIPWALAIIGLWIVLVYIVPLLL